MASHLTVIPGTSAGGTIGKFAFGGQSTAAQDGVSAPAGLMGLFAALLDNLTANAPTAPLPGASPVPGTVDADMDLASLFRLGLDAGLDDSANQDSADPDAIAAAMDLSAKPAMAADPAPMVNFVEALTALKTSLDQGEPLDAELVAKVEATLSDLAEALGLDLDTLPVPEDFAALLETTAEDATGLAGAVTQLLAPLSQSLASAQPATDMAAVAEAPLANAQLKTLGDKLGAFLAALESADVPAEKLAMIGMPPGQPLDAEIETALARFAASLSQQATSVPEEPILAAPALKVTEPVLAGKTAASLGNADPSPAAPNPVGMSGTADERSTDSQSMSDQPREQAVVAARDKRNEAMPVAPAPTDASNIPAPSADANAQQPATSRVDAAANPRIIQAGYQTSQQQLNLPQIAFELARQVQDGNTRFQIRLDPPELGRIDVRLDIDQSGQVNARLVVEKSETLDLMQRDQRGLERALQQAGLDSAKTNLEFSLKQNPFAGQQGQMGEGRGQSGAEGGATANDNGPSAAEAEQAPPMVSLYRGALQASGVNIIA